MLPRIVQLVRAVYLSDTIKGLHDRSTCMAIEYLLRKSSHLSVTPVQGFVTACSGLADCFCPQILRNKLCISWRENG